MSDYVTVNCDVDIPMSDIDDNDLIDELKDRGYTVFRSGDGSRYFGMFSEAGNQLIYNVTLAARKNNWSWPQTLEVLTVISKLPDYKECLDTAVREYVYETLEYDTDFYI